MLPSCLSATVLTIPKYLPLAFTIAAFTIRIATVLPEQGTKPDSGGIIQGHDDKKNARNKNARSVTTKLLSILCHTRVCMPTTRMQ